MIAIAEFLLPLNPGLWLIIGAFVAILLPQSLSRWFAIIFPILLIPFLLSLNFGNYGFIMCVGLVIGAKLMRIILMRREDYYDSDS